LLVAFSLSPCVPSKDGELSSVLWLCVTWVLHPFCRTKVCVFKKLFTIPYGGSGNVVSRLHGTCTSLSGLLYGLGCLAHKCQLSLCRVLSFAPTRGAARFPPPPPGSDPPSSPFYRYGLFLNVPLRSVNRCHGLRGAKRGPIVFPSPAFPSHPDPLIPFVMFRSLNHFVFLPGGDLSPVTSFLWYLAHARPFPFWKEPFG